MITIEFSERVELILGGSYQYIWADLVLSSRSYQQVNPKVRRKINREHINFFQPDFCVAQSWKMQCSLLIYIIQRLPSANWRPLGVLNKWGSWGLPHPPCGLGLKASLAPMRHWSLWDYLQACNWSKEGCKWVFNSSITESFRPVKKYVWILFRSRLNEFGSFF